MDIEKFFLNGYSSLQAPSFIANTLLGLMEKELWVSDEHKGLLIPSWANVEFDRNMHIRDREQAIAKQLNQSTPKHYTHLIHSLINHDSFCANLKSLGKLEITGIAIWNGVEELGWHWDGYDAGDYVLLCYLSRNAEWRESQGGGLSLGTRILDNDWLGYAESNVTLHETIKPNHGQIVLINNQNPKFVHMTTKLANSKMNRYTLSVSIALKKSSSI